MSASDSPKKNTGHHVDLGERGTDKNGDSISLDRRLFMKFTAFGACTDPAPAIKALENLGADGVLYLNVNDPQGIGILIMSENPDYFVTNLRRTLNEPPFSNMCCKNEFEMLGRTYSIGYETDLVETLFTRPQQRVTNPDLRWAVWYPLRRAKNFETLSVSHKRRILAEHGTLGKRFGSAGLASDIRLACHGLDKNDNDFIVGLLGKNLHPLSTVIQEMRGTEQTSQYLDSLGPFFVGKVAWQSKQAKTKKI